MTFFEKYRLYISILLGAAFALIVVFIWNTNNISLRQTLQNKVTDTHALVTQQFRKALMHNVNQLNNLGSRIEFTGGDYFEHWNSDAGLIVRQEPSFRFIEWIDSTMVIQRVEPLEGNEAAVGLDISGLDYRNSDWLKARRDSVFNLTHWLELVQGNFAFLVDAPVYIDGQFQGTITAGMDFSEKFNDIMRGLDEYHVSLYDDRGTRFYTYGIEEGTKAYQDMAVTGSISIGDANGSVWMVDMVPNRLFGEANFPAWYNLNFILALLLCIMLSVTFFFMSKSVAAEKSYREANRKLRALIDSSPVAIYVINSDGVVTDFWNNAAEEMLGWKKEEVIGNFIPHVSDDHRDEFKYLMERILEEGGLVNREITRTRKDGSKGEFRINVGTMTGDDRQMLVLLEDITREKEYEQKLKNSIKEKEVLLTEIHHRVKNNLAIVVGLIDLQKDGVEKPETRQLFDDTQNRIFSIASVHEMLYKTEDFSRIPFNNYLDKLIERMKKTYGKKHKNISIKRQANSFKLGMTEAIPLGLLLNELITNSYKHAFGKTDDARIEMELHKEDETIKVRYRDNGTGFDPALFKEGGSMGVTLIKTLLKQLDAEWELTGGNGSGFGLRFRFSIQNSSSASA